LPFVLQSGDCWAKTGVYYNPDSDTLSTPQADKLLPTTPNLLIVHATQILRPEASSSGLTTEILGAALLALTGRIKVPLKVAVKTVTLPPKFVT
jgi:hypothetical protein